MALRLDEALIQSHCVAYRPFRTAKHSRNFFASCSIKSGRRICILVFCMYPSTASIEKAGTNHAGPQTLASLTRSKDLADYFEILSTSRTSSVDGEHRVFKPAARFFRLEDIFHFSCDCSWRAAIRVAAHGSQHRVRHTICRDHP
jgi:hypothetical protein